jgi:hypothetical protein
MKLAGCYCGSVRYQAEGEPMFKASAIVECQYISGGHQSSWHAGTGFVTKGQPNHTATAT